MIIDVYVYLYVVSLASCSQLQTVLREFEALCVAGVERTDDKPDDDNFKQVLNLKNTPKFWFQLCLMCFLVFKSLICETPNEHMPTK